MSKIYGLVIIGFCVYIFSQSLWHGRIKRIGHKKELNPRNEKLTMFDVRRLLIKGEKDIAIQVYCEIFKTNPGEARRAVEEIERCIQPKDFEL